jgi:UDP-N-acetylmuramyl pentapeptide phosphotransferase/UDP-N-acetylglucosamine-1-phosphate transferase
MSTYGMSDAIRAAGAIYVGIMVANAPLPRRLRVRERLAGVPRFLRQIFYVHWIYIVLLLGMFAGLCFGFADDLSGANALGRFLSAFMAAFWLLRIALQVLYYDRQVRRENRGLDLLYMTALVFLVVIFGVAALRPVR